MNLSYNNNSCVYIINHYEYLRSVITHVNCCTISCKSDYFWDFQFAFLHTKTLLHTKFFMKSGQERNAFLSLIANSLLEFFFFQDGGIIIVTGFLFYFHSPKCMILMSIELSRYMSALMKVAVDNDASLLERTCAHTHTHTHARWH